MTDRSGWLRSLAGAVIAGVVAGLTLPSGVSGAGVVAKKLEIYVLSSRPDLVTGGDALIEVTLPPGADPESTHVTVSGRDVTGTFRVQGAHTLVGLVEGLPNGASVVQAASGRASARLELTNHPIAGPVLSGPHLQPFVCMTEQYELGKPLDADCSSVTKIDYFYRSRAGEFQSLPQPFTTRPPDLAFTTTTDGTMVPYIVRAESGTINRSIYRIAILDDPAMSSRDRWEPGRGWNRRLVAVFGGGTGTRYTQGLGPGVDAAVADQYLSRGFAHLSSSLMTHGLQANDILSGETLMMLKEHFIERYGVPLWTVGSGRSSGAMHLLLIAQNLPGLLDGLLMDTAYPDHISVWSDVTDCRLLRRYFSNQQSWTKEQQEAVEGSTFGTCEAWEPLVDSIVATNVPGCGIDAVLVYDPTKNPKGARCTIFDTNVNSYGRDPVTGAAHRTLDNVGVEYGRRALLSGAIASAQFVGLNRGIGGYDNDGNVRAERAVADPEALRLAYAAGRVNSGAGALQAIPILQVRPYLDLQGNIHDRARDFAIRTRLIQANGRADNDVIWIAAARTPAFTDLALDTMRMWLDGIARDQTSDGPAVKTRRARPSEATDACWDSEGHRIDEPFVYDAPSRCNALYPTHGNPRLAAGGPLSGIVLKCQLKPLTRASYPGVSFADDEWRQLVGVFPGGVCDYSKPGVNQGQIAGTYQSLPLAPTSSRTKR